MRRAAARGGGGARPRWRAGALILADGDDRLAPHLPWGSTTRIEAVRDAVAALAVDGRAAVLGPRSWEARAVLAAGGVEVLAGRGAAERWCRRWDATLVADVRRPFETGVADRLLAAARREPAPAWLGVGIAVVCTPSAAAHLVLDGRLPGSGTRRLSGTAADRPAAAAAPAPAWLQVRPLAEGLWCLREPVALLAAAFDTDWVNAYLLVGRERALLFDTGVGVADYAAAVRSLTDLPLVVVNSHADWDHVGGDATFPAVWCHPGDARALAGRHPQARLRRALSRRSIAPWLPAGFAPQAFALPPRRAEGWLRDGQRFDLGGLDLQVLHTPGHTPGSVCLWAADRGLLLSADTAYAGPVFAADAAAFCRSAQRLAALGTPAACLGGHGPVPAPPEVIDALAAGSRSVLDGAGPGPLGSGRPSAAGARWREYDLGPCSLVVRQPAS